MCRWCAPRSVSNTDLIDQQEAPSHQPVGIQTVQSRERFLRSPAGADVLLFWQGQPSYSWQLYPIKPEQAAGNPNHASGETKNGLCARGKNVYKRLADPPFHYLSVFHSHSADRRGDLIGLVAHRLGDRARRLPELHDARRLIDSPLTGPATLTNRHLPQEKQEPRHATSPVSFSYSRMRIRR
jgi:hypothetical protein